MLEPGVKLVSLRRRGEQDCPVGVTVGVLAAIVFGAQAQVTSLPVTIEAVTVRPEMPPAGVYCLLGVRVKNSGTQTATNFRFRVTIDAQEQTVYAIEVYAVNIDPGTVQTIDLNSFLVPQVTRSPFPVTVTLAAAQWADVKKEGQTISITPLGQVGGLPVSLTQLVSPAPTASRP